MRRLFTVERKGCEEHRGEMWDGKGEDSEGYGNEAPGLEEKPREGPPSHIGLPSLWEEPLLASGPSGESRGACPWLL